LESRSLKVIRGQDEKQHKKESSDVVQYDQVLSPSVQAEGSGKAVRYGCYYRLSDILLPLFNT